MDVFSKWIIIMVYSRCLVLFSSLPKNAFCTEHGLGEDVDEVIKYELGDIALQPQTNSQNFKETLQMALKNITFIKNNIFKHTENTTRKVNETKPETDNIEKYLVPGDYLNGTQVLERVRMSELQLILKNKVNRLEQVKNNVDGLEEITKSVIKREPKINGRRASESNNVLLESMLLDTEYAIGDIPIPKKDDKKGNLRWMLGYAFYKYMHLPWYIDAFKWNIKIFIWHFVFRVQYYVTLAQQKRERYLHHPSYKIGFCFALLRQLIYEMRKVMMGLRHYQWRFKYAFTGKFVSWSLYIFEKIQRLEKDIRDIIHHIKIQEYERKKLIDPQYYDYLPSSTGRYSG